MKCFPAIRRRRPGEDAYNPLKRQPVLTAHVDQTFKAATARVHRHLPAEEVPELLKHRYQIINLWRPLKHAAYDWPLALCDYRSVDKDLKDKDETDEKDRDVFPVALVYPHMEGETYSVRYNPKLEWKYLRGMKPDEFVLIKW